jgi:hypothetical protein
MFVLDWTSIGFNFFFFDCSTLQKFQSCLRELGGLGKFKRFFKQSEITAQLDSCEKELRTTSEVFTVRANPRKRATADKWVDRLNLEQASQVPF